MQGLLAVVFTFSGSQKATKSKPQLIAAGQTGVAPFPLPAVWLAAAAELLAVAGLILPWATGIAPVLTPLAACGLAVVMIGATWSHITLSEFKTAAMTTILLALCVLVAVGRFGDL